MNAVVQGVNVVVQVLFDDTNFRGIGVESLQEGFTKLMQVCF
jgi:hypothetical protein